MVKGEFLSVPFLYTHSATATSYAVITLILHSDLNLLLYVSGLHGQADVHPLTRGCRGTRQVPGFDTTFAMTSALGEARELF